MKTQSRIIMISLLICAILSACGQSQAEKDATSTQTALAPTATATFTPSPTATRTPTPTLTPTPTQTYTPTPTKNPLAGEFVDEKLVMTYESYSQLFNLGQEWYSQGYYLSEIALYDAMLDYSLQPDQIARIYNLQGEDYEELGQYDLAIENYMGILDMGIRKPDVLNGICWDYAIINQAKDALTYCEEAVKQEPSNTNLDSRGVVYTLLGRYPEAISDFEAALKLDGYPNDTMKTQRQEWVTTLQAGNNPITAEILEKERVAESSLIIDPWYRNHLTLSYLRQQYEEDGYTFEETTIEGQKGLIGALQKDNCQVEIVLMGTEQDFKGGTSTILDCSHNGLSAHAWEFIYAFTKDVNETAQAIVWQSADWYYVIEGKPITDLTPTYGGYQFSVERTSEAGKDGIIVKAKPANNGGN